MKILMLVLTLAALTGCASSQRWEEMKRQRAQEKETAAAFELAKETERQNLEPGMSPESIVKLFGSPDQKSLLDGKWTYWFARSEYDDPMYIRFDKTEKLEAFWHDKETAAQNRSVAENRKNTESLKKRKCVTSPGLFGTVNTNCH